MIRSHTGPLVAAALSSDADHLSCVRLFTDMHTANRELLVPATVVAEVGYLRLVKPGPRLRPCSSSHWPMAISPPSS